MVVLAASILATMQVLGVTLIAATLVIPPTVARMLTNSFSRMLWLATAIGAACGFVGMNLSYHLDVQSGPDDRAGRRGAVRADVRLDRRARGAPRRAPRSARLGLSKSWRQTPSGRTCGTSRNVSTAMSGSRWLALRKAWTLRSRTFSTPWTMSSRIVC